ncbi:MAG: hypothetical protein M1839_002592 [Geoglossum umbratile]|nr:MAG: hypothetical protein M1839_002592 [Geoglossum umbratile]
MLQSLSPSPATFTQDQVRQVFRDGLNAGLPGTTTVFRCDGTARSVGEGLSQWYTREKRSERAKEWCKNYHLQVQDPTDCLARIDAAFSELLVCKIVPTDPEEAVVDQACRLLSRLPARPLEPSDLGEISHGTLPSGYFLGAFSHEASREPPRDTPWEQLQVVVSLSTNVIRLALLVVTAGETWWAGIIREYTDTIAELLETSSELSAMAEGRANRQAWLVVRAFLWSSWQRSVMLFFSSILEAQLRGYDYERNVNLALRRPLMHPTSRESDIEPLQRDERPGKARYMCSWAFELLRTDRASIGLDFRRFHEAYAELFGSLPGRCHEGSQEACDGVAPDHCQRFIGMKIKDQSAHDSTCSRDCTPLLWDEESYRRVGGARAIWIDGTDGHILRYCRASEKTLAVSHVWSHGQGGRPETGFNSCLHRRYVSIARSFGCDSYWMDTPCIPEDHQLRAESISKINEVFTSSKITLVCDKDLMEIDTSNLTLRLRESILSALLVCDWNIRAWTLLEAMRGRRNIYLLCKDNKAVSLKETLETVHREGSIDIAVLFLTAQQLVPSRIPPSKKPNLYSENLAKGFIGVQEASCLLNHRHASRQGDEVVIWSLLCDERVHTSAEAFWKAKVGGVINTGFLVSNAPRVQNCKGFSWAPRRPSTQLGLHSEKNSFASDGEGSCWGLVREEGYKAKWLTCEIKGGDANESRMKTWVNKILSSRGRKRDAIQDIAARYLKDYRWGALLHAMEQSSGYSPARYRHSDGTLLVVVGSNDQVGWEWTGVYEWDDADPLPEFKARDVFLA